MFDLATDCTAQGSGLLLVTSAVPLSCCSMTPVQQRPLSPDSGCPLTLSPPTRYSAPPFLFLSV